jgi:thiol-disulfide isomerase/thioredoxin
MRGRVLLAATALAVATGTAGCSSSTSGAGSAFVSGDGTVVLLPPAKRSAPVQLAGTTLEGARFDLASYRGKVVVLNVWGSWCPPCRKEAPELQAAWTKLKPQGVQFVGIDTGPEETTPQALAYQRTFGITYPSVADEGGKALLPLRGAVAPNAVPSTVVIDAQSRVAARISGPTDSATLVGLVQDVANGSGGATG